MAGARTKGVGTGVNWGAFGNIAGLIAGAGKDRGAGLSSLGAALGAGIGQFGANKRRDKELADAKAEREAAQAQEMAYRSERDKVGDARWEAGHKLDLEQFNLSKTNMERDDAYRVDQDKAQQAQAKQSSMAAIITAGLKSGADIRAKMADDKRMALQNTANSALALYKETLDPKQLDIATRAQQSMAAMGGLDLGMGQGSMAPGAAQATPTQREPAAVNPAMAEDVLRRTQAVEAAVKESALPEAKLLMERFDADIKAADGRVAEAQKDLADASGPGRKGIMAKAKAEANLAKALLERTFIQTRATHGAKLVAAAERVVGAGVAQDKAQAARDTVGAAPGADTWDPKIKSQAEEFAARTGDAKAAVNEAQAAQKLAADLDVNLKKQGWNLGKLRGLNEVMLEFRLARAENPGKPLALARDLDPESLAYAFLHGGIDGPMLDEFRADVLKRADVGGDPARAAAIVFEGIPANVPPEQVKAHEAAIRRIFGLGK